MTIGKKTNRYKPSYTLLKTGRGRGGRGQLGFYLLAGLSVLLIAAGLFFTGSWVSAGGPAALFPSDTPTPPLTYTPSSPPTITLTPTLTPIPATPAPAATRDAHRRHPRDQGADPAHQRRHLVNGPII